MNQSLTFNDVYYKPYLSMLTLGAFDVLHSICKEIGPEVLSSACFQAVMEAKADPTSHIEGFHFQRLGARYNISLAPIRFDTASGDYMRFEITNPHTLGTSELAFDTEEHTLTYSFTDTCGTSTFHYAQTSQEPLQSDLASSTHATYMIEAFVSLLDALFVIESD